MTEYVARVGTVEGDVVVQRHDAPFTQMDARHGHLLPVNDLALKRRVHALPLDLIPAIVLHGRGILPRSESAGRVEHCMMEVAARGPKHQLVAGESACPTMAHTDALPNGRRTTQHT